MSLFLLQRKVSLFPLEIGMAIHDPIHQLNLQLIMERNFQFSMNKFRLWTSQFTNKIIYEYFLIHQQIFFAKRKVHLIDWVHISIV